MGGSIFTNVKQGTLVLASAKDVCLIGVRSSWMQPSPVRCVRQGVEMILKLYVAAVVHQVAWAVH